MYFHCGRYSIKFANFVVGHVNFDNAQGNRKFAAQAVEGHFRIMERIAVLKIYTRKRRLLLQVTNFQILERETLIITHGDSLRNRFASMYIVHGNINSDTYG